MRGMAPMRDPPYARLMVVVVAGVVNHGWMLAPRVTM